MSKNGPIINLPCVIWGKICAYLTATDITESLTAVNRKLYKLLSNNGSIIAEAFFRQIKVPYQYGGYEFASLTLLEKKGIIGNVSEGGSERIPLFSYFTDGGVQDDDTSYFVDNIFSDNPEHLYSSVKGENVHVKALCSDSISAKWKLKSLEEISVDETYRIPIDKLLLKCDPQNGKSFGILKYCDINKQFNEYTCLLQSFALFVSMEEIDPSHPLVQLFDGVKKLEQLQELGFDTITLQDDQENHIVEFSLESTKSVEKVLQKNKGEKAGLNGVYPLLWGEIARDADNYINLTQWIGFKHVLLKLIDSHKEEGDHNIDCYNMTATGIYIKLKESTEE